MDSLNQREHETSRAASDAGDGRDPRIVWGLIAGLLCMHVVLGLHGARQLTVTHDEYWHLPVGLLNLKTGRFDYDNLNPPLVRMWAALPLLFTSANEFTSDYQAEATAYGDAFVRQASLRDRDAQTNFQWFTIGRAMIVLLSAATGLVLAIWARELFGNGAAVLTALLWSTCPNILAHGSLMTTDLGAAAFFVFTLYATWKHAERPTWKKTILWGVILGLAQLAKYTCVLLYPLSLALWMIWRVRNPDVTATTWKKSVVQGVVVCGLSVAILNAGYLFHGCFSEMGSYKFQSRTFTELSTRLGPLNRLPVPLPRDYVQGLDRQKDVMEHSHAVFLDGQWRVEGFANYYLKALLYKLPHALQLLALCALLFLVSPGPAGRNWRTQAAILLPAVAMLTAAGAGGMQLGIRYVLPALPFIMLFAGQAARWWSWRLFPLRTAITFALAVTMSLSLRYHPHHLAYFNELAGGPIGGRAHLLDSNLDWGQDLRGLKVWIDANPPQENFGLAYFGTFPPEALGIHYRVPPSRIPQPGWYAVSVNFVMGRPFKLRDETGMFRRTDIYEFGYFKFFEPVARIGYSIDVYHITEADVDRWRAVVQRGMSR